MSGSDKPPPLPITKDGKGGSRELGDMGDAQATFDTVAGPNFRLRDNLIQLAAIVVAVIIGVPIAFLFVDDAPLAIMFGIFGGLVGGVFISGVALGIYRFKKSLSRGKRR